MEPNLDFTTQERIIIANQFKIRALLATDYDEKKTLNYWAEILENGYEGLYYEIEPNFFSSTSRNVSNEVFAIVSMFQDIQASIGELTPMDQQKLDLYKLTFQGFDHNEESAHCNFLHWWLGHHPDRFSSVINLREIAYSQLNKYQKILKTYKSFGSLPFKSLTFDQLLKLQE